MIAKPVKHKQSFLQHDCHVMSVGKPVEHVKILQHENYKCERTFRKPVEHKDIAASISIFSLDPAQFKLLTISQPNFIGFFSSAYG